MFLMRDALLLMLLLLLLLLLNAYRCRPSYPSVRGEFSYSGTLR
jgi:hypothetical protein